MNVCITEHRILTYHEIIPRLATWCRYKSNVPEARLTRQRAGLSNPEALFQIMQGGWLMAKFFFYSRIRVSTERLHIN